MEEALALAREVNDPETTMAALNSVALLEHASGSPEQAVRYGMEALALAHQLGDRHRQVRLHSNVADFLHALGREDDALEN